MKKKVLAGILTAAMTMFVFGSVCAFAESETPTIAFVPKVTGQVWWDHVQENVEEWAADEGIDVIYKGPTDTDAAANERRQHCRRNVRRQHYRSWHS